MNIIHSSRLKDKEDEKYRSILENARDSQNPQNESWRVLSSELPLSHPHFISASPRFLAIRAAS